MRKPHRRQASWAPRVSVAVVALASRIAHVRRCERRPSLNNSPLGHALGTPAQYTKLTLSSHLLSGELLSVQPRSRSTPFFEICGHTPCHRGTMTCNSLSQFGRALELC